MKRFLLMSAVLTCLSLQVSAENKAKSVVFYDGVRLRESSMISEKSSHGMNCENNKVDYSIVCSYDNYKRNHIGRMEKEVGVKLKYIKMESIYLTN